MTEKTYSYPLSYKLHYIPGILFISCILVLAVLLPSTTKVYGYTVIAVVFVWFCILVFLERKKVAINITVSDDGLTADKFLSEEVFIRWSDIEALNYAGRGLFLVSGKLEKYLYAEVIALNRNKIVIRREIKGYHELIKEVQTRTGRTFQPADAVR